MSRRTSMLPILWISLLASPAASEEQPQPPVLRFEFEKLRSDSGVVACALYASDKDFLSRSFREVLGRIRGGRAVCVFENVPPGTYALGAYHDENLNYKLDTNWLGIPKEGVGASNNARGVLGPPRFRNALFVFDGRPYLQQRLRMRY